MRSGAGAGRASAGCLGRRGGCGMRIAEADLPAAAQGFVELNQVLGDRALRDGQLVLLLGQNSWIDEHPVEVDFSLVVLRITRSTDSRAASALSANDRVAAGT